MRLPPSLVVVVALTAPAMAVAQPDPLVRPLPTTGVGTETLGKFLRDLGYDPKPLSPDVYQITVERDRWPVHIMLSLSTDGRRVWLESKFAPVEEPDRVPPIAWQRLLESNERIGPAHFAFDKNDRRVHLYKSFDNAGLAADRLKREIDHFDLTVRKTQDVWRAESFKPVLATSDAVKLPPEPLKPMPASKPIVTDEERFAGSWRITGIHVNGVETPAGIVQERKASLVVECIVGSLHAKLRTGGDKTRSVRILLKPVEPNKVTCSEIDLIDEEGGIERAVYHLDGDLLKIHVAPPGDARPANMLPSKMTRAWLLEMRRN